MAIVSYAAARGGAVEQRLEEEVVVDMEEYTELACSIRGTRTAQ